MKESISSAQVIPFESGRGFDDHLTSILRQGAKAMLQAAIESEVAEYVSQHKDCVDADGRRTVVRNGHHPERDLQTGIGPITIKKPKVNDKRVDEQGERFRFHSSIIPAYLKRTKSVEELIPWLYLRGISTGDFPSALEALLGKDAPGLSSASVVRLKKHWEDDFATWSTRDLSNERFVYFWADGIYPRVRLEGSESQCFLVIMGATKEGKKELVAIGEGLRESEDAWTEVLRDLKRRGLKTGPELAVGDGALGFWAAVGKEFPNAAQQRCWVHKTGNITAKLPKSSHNKAKGLLKDIYSAETRKQAEAAMDHFCDVFDAKHPKAVTCLVKDKIELLAFFDFPAEHWVHVRTTNPIESLFATIRLRTKRTKGHGSAKAALSMAFKLAQCAEKKWNKLRGSQLIADVISINFKFQDGVKIAVAA
jgi:transposase-like protein